MRLHLAIALLVFAFSATAIVQRMRTPMPTYDDRVVKQGAELYGRMCAVCHGDWGEGYRADEAPRLAHPEFLASVTDDYLVKAIAYGRTNTTMSAWSRERGGPLSRQELDALVLFMRTWDKKPKVQLDESPPTGSLGRASLTYVRECRQCHGQQGIGGPNIHIGGKEFLESATPGFLRHAITLGRNGTAMPAFGEKLGKEGVEDMVTLLATWKRQARTSASRELPTPPPPTPPLPFPLGAVPLNPGGPDPIGFSTHPSTTKIDVIKQQLDRKAKMVLMDARTPSDYVREHIAGAVSVPFYDPSPYFDKLPKDAWLVAYCSCPHAESRTLATKLMDKGFKRVTVLDEGLGVWKQKKLPVATGEKP
jgi:cytochrome c oxidase cbb3-type subunit 3